MAVRHGRRRDRFPVIGADGMVYIVSGGNLFALNGTTGQKLWMSPGHGDLMIAADGTLVDFRPGWPEIQGMDPTTGAERWHLGCCYRASEAHLLGIAARATVCVSHGNPAFCSTGPCWYTLMP